MKNEILMNKPVYLGLSILELSKILMYEFLYNYVRPKYGEKAKLCYMDTGSFILYVKTYDVYKDAENCDRPLLKGKNKKVIGLMKGELGRKNMTKFVGLRAKLYNYLIDNGSEDKKAKRTKKCYKKKT